MTVVTRLKELDPSKLIPDSDPRYWEGLLKFATDRKQDNLIKEVNNIIEASENSKPTNNLNLDSMLPTYRTRAYSDEIVSTQSMQHLEVGIDYEAFGADRSYDPRASEIVVTEETISGLASRFCCGVDPTTMQTMMRDYVYRRGWYTIGYELCWTSQIELEFAGLTNWIARYSGMANKLLTKSRIEVGMYGDQIWNLRGLTDLGVRRLRLDQPLDRLTPEEVYDVMNICIYEDQVRRGEESLEKTHMLAPPGFQGLLNTRMTGTTVGEKLKDSFSTFGLKSKYSKYMSRIGVDNTPCALLWNRNSQEIKRDIAFEPFMLPIEENRGKIYLQFVMYLGELRVESNNSALIIENLLTKAN